MITSKNLQRYWRPGFSAGAVLALLLAGALQPAFAQTANEPGFASADQAIEALYKAVATDDETTISRLIGPLSSSSDMVQDKADRLLFIQKYSEMHRLVKGPDGITILYIGAENWPFPVPLVSKKGKWSFDVDAGTQEIMFRSIGENEMSAIETCRAIARATRHSDTNTDDNAINAYAQRVVQSASAPDEAFHGYYFRLLRTRNGAVVIAYPSQYGSSGVMTFAATTDGPVYEKDLGPNTATVAKSRRIWSPNASWHVAQ